MSSARNRHKLYILQQIRCTSAVIMAQPEGTPSLTQRREALLP